MRKNLLLAIAFILGIWAYLLLLAGPTRPAGAAVKPSGPVNEGISAYFSPSGGCTQAVITEINKASATIDAQAYVFTSAPIAQAICSACDRGVHVRVILDKSQKTDHYSSATFLQNHHVPVYIDDQHNIAHNKVVLIDGKVIITGSFNFTKTAEDKNAENLLVIRDRPKLMASYQSNFERHLNHSVPLAAPSK